MIKNKIHDTDFQPIKYHRFSNNYKMNKNLKKHCKSSSWDRLN